MRIGMQTWGSHGDIRPFLALAEGLQSRGHAVHLLITCVDSAAYADVRSAAGVKITVLDSPVLNKEEAKRVAETAYSIRNPMTQMATILRMCLDPVEDRMFAAAQCLCLEADLLIGHYFMHPLQTAAEQAGRPYASVLLSHAAVPSAFSHPLGLGMLGRTGNRLLWRVTQAALNRSLLHYPNRLRRALGMPPVRDIVTQCWIAQPLTLLGVSPQICNPQPDWPAAVQACGFLDMPNLALEGSVPPQLAAFLAAGEAPVYMTLGSWMPKDIPGQAATLQLLSEAARLAGCRAIIQSDDAQACGFASSARLLYIRSAPHAAVFPHCAAVVHHGGAGTTQSATLAGVPSIVVAHISEQEHWGRELQRIGVGAAWARRRSMTAPLLARQIGKVQGTPAFRQRADAIAALMRQEDGVARAVALIEQRFGTAQDSPGPAARGCGATMA